MLKPQDILIAVKLQASLGRVPYRGPRRRAVSQRMLAETLKISLSEVSGGLKRLERSGLVSSGPITRTPELISSSMEEFLIHGLKYVFPVQLGEITRGMPTGYAADPLRAHFPADRDELVPVWPDPHGEVRGHTFEPLYRSVPFAAREDAQVYQAMVLIDAIRGGRTRERNMAIDLLKRWLHGTRFEAKHGV
jgi:hypothetical protein